MKFWKLLVYLLNNTKSYPVTSERIVLRKLDLFFDINERSKEK